MERSNIRHDTSTDHGKRKDQSRADPLCTVCPCPWSVCHQRNTGSGSSNRQRRRGSCVRRAPNDGVLVDSEAVLEVHTSAVNMHVYPSIIGLIREVGMKILCIEQH